MDRRCFVKNGCRAVAFVSLGSLATALVLKSGQARSSSNPDAGNGLVWQIDPNLCVGCGKCSASCVLDTSAVKCFHNEKLCGYCEICTGFFDDKPVRLDEGAENQMCPTNAIRRQKAEANYYEYSIDLERCVGCGKCVRGCTDKGNGSLFLQIDQALCRQCNQCTIALECPAQAISQIPAAHPYRLKS